MYLHDFIEYCKNNPGISGELYASNYDKYFTTTEILTPIGEILEVQSYLSELSQSYQSASRISTTFTLRNTKLEKDRVTEMLNFMRDNVIVSSYAQKYVFTTPDLEDGETIVAAKGDSWGGEKTTGSIPNISGSFNLGARYIGNATGAFSLGAFDLSSITQFEGTGHYFDSNNVKFNARSQGWTCI